MTIRTAAKFLLATALVGGALAGVQSVAHAQEARARWKMATMFGMSFKPIGEHIKRMTEDVELLTGGSVRIQFSEPGALVPTQGIFDAVSKGSIEAGYAGISFWQGKEPAMSLYNAAPFLPDLAETLAWLYHGGGIDVLKDILKPHNIHPILCGVIAPEAGGWFRKEIKTVQDLAGLKMRIGGLGANVLERLGVSTQVLAGGDVYPALERGVIDAAELSSPAMDLSFGFHEIAKHYYYPGWHNMTSPEWLLINLDAYNKLSDKQKKTIDIVCGNTVARSIAESEALQFSALQTIKAKQGVQLHRWPDELLARFKELWEEEAAKLAATNANFAKAWESYSTFRKNFAVWEEFKRLN